MVQDPPPSRPKRRFQPKKQASRTPTPVVAKTEDEVQNHADEQALVQRVKEAIAGRKSKEKKESSVQVAFCHGTSSTQIKAFGKPKERTDVEEKHAFDDKGKLVTGKEIVDENGGFDDSSVKKKKKEYREPWDYENSNYPSVHPWRPPYSGDPEILDKAEFENAKVVYDESTLNSASELGLGLQDKDEKPRLIMFQFPPCIPLGIDNKRFKGKEIAGSSVDPSKTVCSLEELPNGFIGKLKIYESGKVKFQIGNVLYDVSPSTECKCYQAAAAVNTIDSHLCDLGQVMKTKANVTPDLDSMLDNM